MKMSQRIDIKVGIETLVHAAGTNSRDKGFHEDWPMPDVNTADDHSIYPRQMQLAIVEKLALIHEEISEALGEIRSGHAPTKTYYRDKDGETFKFQNLSEEYGPMLKPEGFGIELADAAIRIADLAYLTGIDLGAVIIEKAAYNATRPYKHNRSF